MTALRWKLLRKEISFNLKNSCYIALGSNIGDRQKNIISALEEISGNPLCKVEKISSIYETGPFGYTEQDNFLNAAALVSTDLEILPFFYFIKSVEEKLGRVKTIKWGPRLIDVDLLFFNNLIYKDDVLQVPHKGIQERDFVLVPLCELDPELIHPVLNQKICDICSNNIQKTIIGIYSQRDTFGR